MSGNNDKDLKINDVDILALIGSDLCESIRDLIYNIKEVKKDVDLIKNKLDLFEK